MNKEEFIELIGKDTYIEYPSDNGLEMWNMAQFYIDEQGEISHYRLDLIIDKFIKNAINPHKGKTSH